MFNTLTRTEQQEVNTVIEAIGETDNEMLTTEAQALLYPDAPDTLAKDLIRNMVARIITDRQETAQDFIDEDLIPTLVLVLSHFIDWCDAYITIGDRIPDYRITDIFAIASTTHHDYWHERIANNLSYIPALVKETQGGENVSTALFDAIINTAFVVVWQIIKIYFRLKK